MKEKTWLEMLDSTFFFGLTFFCSSFYFSLFGLSQWKTGPKFDDIGCSSSGSVRLRQLRSAMPLKLTNTKLANPSVGMQFSEKGVQKQLLWLSRPQGARVEAWACRRQGNIRIQIISCFCYLIRFPALQHQVFQHSRFVPTRASLHFQLQSGHFAVPGPRLGHPGADLCENFIHLSSSLFFVDTFKTWKYRWLKFIHPQYGPNCLFLPSPLQGAQYPIPVK